MKLERLEEEQISELMQWADDIENILTPDNLVPTHIKEYPQYIETSERLKRICDWMAKNLKEQMQKIEDAHMSEIESAEYVYKYTAGGMPVRKRTFNSAAKQQRELRVRLSQHEAYQKLALEQKHWVS